MLEGPFFNRAHHFSPKDVNPWERRGEKRVKFPKPVIDCLPMIPLRNVILLCRKFPLSNILMR